MDSIRDILPRTADAIAADQHVGCQLYVSRRGETLVNAASGEAAPGVPMTPDSLLCWLSSGKPITAIAIGLLWQRGMLQLDDPVADHIPEFGQHGKEHITIRHLLTHTAGFPLLDTGYPKADWQESLQTVYAASVPSDWAVGHTAGYHVSSSWFILGELIGRLSGKSFEQFVHDEVFQPFGISDAYFAISEEEASSLGNRLGWTWRRVGKELQPLDWHQPPRLTRASPGSSARGPIQELGRFYKAILEILKGGSSPLTPQTVEALVSPHRVGQEDRTFQHIVDFGLGFLVDSNRYGPDTVPYSFGRHCSPRSFGHGGAQSSIGFADPEHDLVVAWAFNSLIGEPRHNIRNRAINTAIYEDLGLV